METVGFYSELVLFWLDLDSFLQNYFCWIGSISLRSLGLVLVGLDHRFWFVLVTKPEVCPVLSH